MFDPPANDGLAPVASDPGTTAWDAPAGGGAAVPATDHSPEVEAQDLRLPFSDHPRWKEVYGGYRRSKELEPQVERLTRENGRLQTAEQELAQYREGTHKTYESVAQDVIQTRDSFWERELAKAGVLDVMRGHFARGQGGQPEANRQPEEAPWQKEVATLREQVAAQDRERKSEVLLSQFDAALKSDAPEFAANPKGYELLLRLATDYAKKDIDPDNRALRQHPSAYVKAAKAHLLDLMPKSGRPASRPPVSGPSGGLPGGDPSRDRRAAALEIARQMAELDGNGG